jgi:predicted glycosyltransferase involved in capsule biosynthesis
MSHEAEITSLNSPPPSLVWTYKKKKKTYSCLISLGVSHLNKNAKIFTKIVKFLGEKLNITINSQNLQRFTTLFLNLIPELLEN